MVYDGEAILLIDLNYGVPRVMQYREQEAKEYLEDALDQLDEARDVALLHSAKYQQHYVDTTAVGSRAEPSTSGT
jgi:hypothetical protein